MTPGPRRDGAMGRAGPAPRATVPSRRGPTLARLLPRPPATSGAFDRPLTRVKPVSEVVNDDGDTWRVRRR